MMRGIEFENLNKKKVKKPDENVAENAGEKPKVENKRNPVTTAAKAAGVVLLGTAISLGAVSCGADKQSSSDVQTEGDADLDGVEGDVDHDGEEVPDAEDAEGDGIPGICNVPPVQVPAANINVSAGWGYEDEEEGTCRTEFENGGCEMGVKLGDTIKLRVGESEMDWTVTEITEEEVTLQNTGMEGAVSTIVLDTTKSIYWDAVGSMPTGSAGLGNLRLAAACVSGICTNGLSADFEDMVGKGVILVTEEDGTKHRMAVAEKSVNTLLIDDRSITVDATVGHISETQMVVSLVITNGIEQTYTEMGVPLTENGGEAGFSAIEDPVFGLTTNNEMSSDVDNTACYRKKITLKFTDEHGTSWEDVRSPGEEFTVNEIPFKIGENVVADSDRDPDGNPVSTGEGTVPMTRMDTGEELTLKTGESQPNIAGVTVEVVSVELEDVATETPDE